MGSGPQAKFDLSRRGDLYFIRFYRDWSLDDAHTFFEAYQKRVLDDGQGRFGVVSDTRLLSSASPEVVGYFETIANWAQQQGQVARALLMGSGYEEFLVRQIDRAANRYPVKAFETEDEAVEWMRGFGLASED